MTCYTESMKIKKELSERVIVAFSGGKDSAAMLDKMLFNKERVDAIYFANTTLEFPEMYKYVRFFGDYIKKKYGKEIFWVYPNATWNNVTKMWDGCEINALAAVGGTR